MGALGGPKSPPSHDPRYIHRFQSLQDPSRRSPSQDLAALPTFQSLQKGDDRVSNSVEPGLSRARADPRTRSRARFFRSLYIVNALNADAPASPEGRRITARHAPLLITHYSRLTTHDLGPLLGLSGAILGFKKEPPNFQQILTRYWSLVLSYHWSLVSRHSSFFTSH